MDQPNFEQQLALVPNLPIINIPQQLAQIQQTLNLVVQILQRHSQQLDLIEQRLQQHGQQLDQIRQDILRLDRNNFAGLLNSSVTRADTPLEILHDVVNQPVQGFPATGAHIDTLKATSLHAR